MPVGDFASPIHVTAPPGDDSRLFVVERAGTIRIVGRSQPFLQISVSTGGERGLLSMAFAPDYASSGRFAVFYTDGGGDVRVDEFRRSASNPDLADPASRRPLLFQEHSSRSNHNGGQLQFGPDGRLYASIGDGGEDAQSAQDPNSFLGKVVRIDVAGGAAEVYALGLRNPFRFSFDRGSGDLVIGDVGQSSQEEVDLLRAGAPPGANFGWPACEGTTCTSPPPPGYVPPVLTRSHSTGDCAITGGFVVRDPGLAALAGRYVYGDFCTGALRSAVLAEPQATDDGPLGLTVASLASFGEDAAGCVYAVSLNGPVYRLAPSAGSPPGPCPLPDPPPGGSPPPTGAPPPGGTGAPPPASTPADTVAPRLSVGRRRVQRLGRHRRFLASVRCDEPCRITVTGRVTWRNGSRAARLRMRGTRRRLAAGERVRVPVRLSRRRARLAGRALRRGRRVLVHVRVTARDATGNRRTERRAIRIRR